MEEEETTALRSRTDKKWKESSKDEDAQSEASAARRVKKDVSTDLVASEASSLGKVVPLYLSSLFPAQGTSRGTCVQPSSSPPSKVLRGILETRGRLNQVGS